MNSVRIATTRDIPLIRQMAEQVFPVTYRHIITSEQCDYMMDMMYSEASLRRQMTEEGHVYQLLSVDGEPAGYVSVQPIEADVYELQKSMCCPASKVAIWDARSSTQPSALSRSNILALVASFCTSTAITRPRHSTSISE